MSGVVCIRLDSKTIAEDVKKEFEEIVKELDTPCKVVELIDDTKLCVDRDFIDYLFLAKEEVLDR